MNDVFVTKDGNRIPLRRVAPILVEKVRQSVVIPTPPTYEVEVVGGDKEFHVHDATTLETDEDKQAWAEYQTALAAANTDMVERILRLLFVRATGDVVPAGDGWVEEQTYFGIAVPVDPMERKIHYIQTELLTHSDDISAFMLAAMGLVGVGNEVIRAAEETFRNPVREGREDAGTDTGQHPADGEVVALPGVSGSGGSKGVGATAQPVGRTRRR